jgi:hypothetical protein
MNRKSVFLISAGLLVVGAIFLSPLLSAAAPSPPIRVEQSSVTAVPTYAVNARGETYGSAEGAVSAAGPVNPSDLPDLIEVQVGNGVFGYITKASFLGTAPTLQQVLQYPKNSKGNLVAPSSTVPVYASDGTTQVGTFEIGGND